MLRIGETDETLNRKAYEKWPLFKRFRKSTQFKTAYKELFKEEFTLEEIHEKKMSKAVVKKSRA